MENKSFIEEHAGYMKNHVATLSENGTKLVWKDPNSTNYQINFKIMPHEDGVTSDFIITGDLGSAILNLTWIPDFACPWGMGLSYLREKVVCWTEDYATWSPDTVVGDALIELNFEEANELDDIVIALVNKAVDKVQHEGQLGKSEFLSALGDELTEEWWEGNITVEIHNYLVQLLLADSTLGDCHPPRLQVWLLALNMAQEQLNVSR